MDNIEIRKVALADVVILRAISIQTFQEAFGAANTEANMRQYLNKNFNNDTLAGELKNPDAEFYFAMLHHKIIGYIKLNFKQAQTELKNANSAEIERIYVLKKYQGKKVGQILLDTAFKIAKPKCVDYLWLGVWEENERAINFYKKNGFVEFGRHIFKLGNDEQTDIMMRLKIADENNIH